MIPILPPVQSAPASIAQDLASQQKQLDEAQALLTTSIQHGPSLDAETTYLKAVQHQPGLLKAWELTSGDSWPPELARRRNEVRMELALRLQDSAKMRIAWQGFLALDGPYYPQEAVHGLFIATHLGQWKVVQAIGQTLTAKDGVIEASHDAIFENLISFDYASIFDLVQSNTNLPLQWSTSDQSFLVKGVRARFQRVESHSAAGKIYGEGLRSMLPQPKLNSDGWVLITDSAPPLLQIGAAAHWIGSAGRPALSGVIDSGRLLLRGKLGDQNLRMVHTFDMHHSSKEAPNQWVGTCRVDIFYRSGFLERDWLRVTPAATVVMDYQWEMSAEAYDGEPNGLKKPGMKQ